MIEIQRELITEDWLKSVGFKWSQLERQPNKHWILWLGGCREHGAMWHFTDAEDIGIEIAFGAYAGADQPQEWFCWFRGDTAGRYHRFIHVRHLKFQDEVAALVAAITGRHWKPANHFHGQALCDPCAERWRIERQRLDIRDREGRTKWSEIEKDDTRAGAQPNHMQAAIDAGKAK